MSEYRFLNELPEGTAAASSKRQCRQWLNSELHPTHQSLTENEAFSFTGFRSLRKKMQDRKKALDNDNSRNQFLILTNFTEDDCEKLSDDNFKTAQQARISYSRETEILVLKILPQEHPLGMGLFTEHIESQFIAMNLQCCLYSLCSMTVKTINYVKEADASWASQLQPLALRLVVEIGLSESAGRLAVEAQEWLESGSTVNVVITITINRDRPEMVIQRWERVSHRYSMPAQGLLEAAITCVQEITVQYVNNKTVASGGLVIPFEKVVDRPARKGTERDFCMTRDVLQTFAEAVWETQQFEPFARLPV